MTTDLPPLTPTATTGNGRRATIAAAVIAVGLSVLAAWQYCVSSALEEENRTQAVAAEAASKQANDYRLREKELDKKIQEYIATHPRRWNAPTVESLESHKQLMIKTGEENSHKAEKLLAELKNRETLLQGEVSALQQQIEEQ